MTKKLVSLTVLLVVIVIVLIYILIPPYVKVHRQVRIYTPEQAVIKYVMHTNKWNNWWPRANQNFIVNKNTITEVTGQLLAGNDTVESTVEYTIRDDKGVYLSWNGVLRTSANPIKRVLRYRAQKRVAQYIDSILIDGKRFLEDDRHVYGIHVQKDKIEYSVVLATKRISKDTLPVEEIYKILHDLKAYASANKAQPVGYPMVNVTLLNTKDYLTTVAIPINKFVSTSKDFFIKRLVYHAPILTVKVKGGNNHVKNALDQLSVYMRDNSYTSPAIPYAELVTDRTLEPDSSKWITRICYPVL